MFRVRIGFVSLILFIPMMQAHAQVPLQTAGTLVIVPAYGEVRQANDEAHVTLMVEEQDKDKAVAASRVNQKMKQGIEIVKREDPQAKLSTRGYYTYPVYPDDQLRQNHKPAQPASWRVGQYLEVVTTNLGALPKTVAAAQRLLALNGLQFGLTEAASKKLDQKRIEATYRNLTERIAAISTAMGRNIADTTIDTVDFEASGAYAPQEGASLKTMMRPAAMPAATPVEEPSFEPGETTLHLRVVGKIRFR
jgi:uncharacterized protein